MDANKIYNECVTYAANIVEFTCEFVNTNQYIYNICNFVDTYYTEILCVIIYSNIISLLTMAICFSLDRTRNNKKPLVANQQVYPQTIPQPQYVNASTQYEFDDVDDLIIEIRNVYSKNSKRIVTLATRATHKVVTRSQSVNSD